MIPYETGVSDKKLLSSVFELHDMHALVNVYKLQTYKQKIIHIQIKKLKL